MKSIKNKLTTAVIIFFLLFSSNLTGQWISTQGPGGGRITCLMNWNSKVYTGTSYGQVYKSLDNGDTWQNSSSGLPTNNDEIAALTGNSFGIYIISHFDGLHFSNNEGASWSNIEFPGIVSIFGYNNNLFAGNSVGELYLSTNGGANWVLSNSGLPQGTIVSYFTAKDNYIFAGTNNGIFKSTNNGSQWSLAPTPTTGITFMTFKGDTLMYGYQTINYSTDFGTNWQTFNTGAPGNVGIYSVAANGSVILGGSFHGIYTSTNSGVTWSFEHINNILNTFETKGLLYSNGRFISGSDAGIYISYDGQNWQPSMHGLTSLYANRLVSSGSDLLANLFGNGGGLHLSSNNGANWIPMRSSSAFFAVQCILPLEDKIFVASLSGVYVTTNKGLNWVSVNSGLSDPAVYTIEYNNGIIYAGTNSHGIFKSSNYGVSWTNISGTLPSQFVRAITFRGNNLFAGTQTGIYMSSDEGTSWISRNPYINTQNITKLYTYRNKIYATSTTSTIDHLYTSSDDGQNWTELTNGLPEFKYSLFFMHRYIFAGTNDGLYISSDNGASWTSINQGFPQDQRAYRAIVKDYYLYAGTTIDGVWKRPLREVLPHYTVSGQVNYRDNNLPVTHGVVKALAYDENTGNIIVVDSAQIQNGGLYMLPHVPMDSLFIMAYPDDEFDFVPTYHPSTIDWRQAERVYAEGNLNNINIGVYRITNGSNPFSVSGGVYRNGGFSFPINNALIYAKSGNDFKNFGISAESGAYVVNNLAPGTYTLLCYRIGYNDASIGVNITSSNLESINFHLSNNLIIVDPPGTVVPDKFSLYQNYPNPFNPVTKIKYDLPYSTNVKLTVFDMLGREIITLVNNEFKKGGRYSVEFNASNLASGVYFYRIEAGDYINSKKMVLVK